MPSLAPASRNESSSRYRDIRNGRVTMIAGQPVVPNSTQTLPCQPAKRVRMHVPMRPIYGCHRSSTTWHHRLRLQDRHRASRRRDHQVVLDKCCEGWASEGKPSPRAPSQHLQAATNPLSHARMPGLLQLLLHPKAQQLSAHARACLLELHHALHSLIVCHRSQAQARAAFCT